MKTCPSGYSGTLTLVKKTEFPFRHYIKLMKLAEIFKLSIRTPISIFARFYLKDERV